MLRFGMDGGFLTVFMLFVLSVIELHFHLLYKCYQLLNIAPTVGRRWMGGECVEWNKKLAAEYEESALKIKGRLDELTAQINAGRNPKGWIDKETERLLRRRATLFKMYGDTVHTAHILDNYYVDK